MQASDDVLEDWCPENVYNYARENDLELTLDDAYVLLQNHFPNPPYGWITATDPDTGARLQPEPYWHKDDALEDINVYRNDGYIDVMITQCVDHCVMCELLDDMIDEARKSNDIL